MRVIYIMWNFPYLYKIKIGIATFGKTQNRVKSIDGTTKGKVFPIFFSILPWGVHSLEKRLHHLFRGLHMPFKNGSGRTEWFFILALFPAVIIITIETIVRWFPLIALVWLALM